MGNSTFLKELYCKSLTPFEVLDISRKYKCIFDKNDKLTYLDSWKKSLSKEGSNEVFYDYCRVNDLNENDISIMTSNIKNILEDIEFPFWIKTLEEVLAPISLEVENIFEEHLEKPFHQLLLPFIDYFHSSFEENLNDLKIKLPSINLINQLNSFLYKDLLNIAHLVLFDEFSKFKKGKGVIKNGNGNFYYNHFISGILSDRFQSLFLSYPMLARKIGTKIHNYLKFLTSVFERFDKDRFEMENLFDEKFRNIINIHLNSGDLHNGESTIILEFENSKKVVYKPANGAITNAYNQLLDWINIRLGCELKSFRVIDKEEYSWLEYVDNIECDSDRDIKLYYQRAGILSGIAFFLNARDYHYENLVAAGNSPVLIDHETIVGPNIKKQGGEKSKIGNVLETLLLPNVMENNAPYMCGFGSSIQMTSDGLVRKIKNCNRDNMEVVLESISRNLYKSNKPKLNNQIKNLKDYQFEFKKGFQQLYNLILENKSLLLSKDSPIIDFGNLKIRYIYRSTGVYFKFLKLLNKPEYLKNAINYGIKIELLARAYAIKGNWSPILCSERQQILLGNIPVFYTNTLSKNLVLPNEQIADEFEFNAIDIINYKIQNASIQDYNLQKDLIQGAISL